MRYFPVTDLRNKNAVELLLKGTKVVLRMTGNAHFPNPNPSLNNLQMALTNLRTALSAYGENSITLERRKKAEREVTLAYRMVAAYVNNIANGDPIIILSSGYDLNSRPAKIYLTESPVVKKAIKSAQPGWIKISWYPIPKSRGYTVYLYNAEEPEVIIWSFHTVKASAILTGLESGKRYIVRVLARGRRGHSPLSNAVLLCESWV